MIWTSLNLSAVASLPIIPQPAVDTMIGVLDPNLLDILHFQKQQHQNQKFQHLIFPFFFSFLFKTKKVKQIKWYEFVWHTSFKTSNNGYPLPTLAITKWGRIGSARTLSRTSLTAIYQVATTKTQDLENTQNPKFSRFLILFSGNKHSADWGLG